MIDLANYTSSALISSLFPEAKTAPDKRRPTTAGFKIKESINQLVDTLSRCTPHYIRCIKPNDRKRNDYDSNLSLHQVKYLGLLENVRVRRAGYAYRQTYEKFFYRYETETCLFFFYKINYLLFLVTEFAVLKRGRIGEVTLSLPQKSFLVFSILNLVVLQKEKPRFSFVLLKASLLWKS